MRFKIEKKELLHVVTLAARASAAKTTMPVLAHVLLQADNGRLTVTGTDLYTEITATTHVAVHEARGAVAVRAKDLISRIKAFPNHAMLSVAATDGPAPVLTITSGTARFSAPGIPSEDYPPPVKHDDSKARRYTIPVETLSRLLDGTSYAVSRDETRAHLNATRIEIGETLYRAVATDAHRLVKIDLARRAPPTRVAKDVRPIEALLLQLEVTTKLARVAKVASGDAELSVTDSNVRCTFDEGRVVVTARTVDATFPPYARVIPTSWKTTVELPRQAFIDAVKALVSSDRTGAVKLELSPGKLVLSAANAETGDESVSVDLPDYAGEHGPIGFNGRYLIEACEAIGDDTITLGLSAPPLEPATFTKATRRDGGEDFIAVVMPMRI